MVRNRNQDQADSERVFYSLRFSELDEKNVQSFLRAISTSLKRGGGLFSTVDTLVFETWATDSGFYHLLGVHRNSATAVINQLRTHIPGLRAEPVTRQTPDYLTDVAEIGMSHPQRLLHIPDGKSFASTLLSSVQALSPNEVVLTQWILSPATVNEIPRDNWGNVMAEKKYSSVHLHRAITQAVRGGGAYTPLATGDEIKERESKFEEPNFSAIGRVAAYSPKEGRAANLVIPVVNALESAKSKSTTFQAIPSVFHNALTYAVNAATPSSFPAQLSILELSAVIGWPLGRPHVAGLSQGASRHLPANESIPREGRILGKSNFPGDERPIAIGRLESLTHLHVMGQTGVGKTTLLGNLVHKDMIDGFGVIVMERKGDLFNASLDAVPHHRIQDTIVLDVTDHKRPIGLNILDQGNPRAVIDQLADLFQNLYPDTRGIWMRELMYFGLNTLVENEGMTFIDLAALISPRTKDEQGWADALRKGAKNKEVREFWVRWQALTTTERDKYASTVHNRIWQLASRPELRNIIGQSKSSFQMEDILRDNKILLINLAGVPSEAANLAGTLIMNAVWSAAQRVHAENPNYLYLDEFQDFIKLPVGAEEMLAKARSFKLSMTLAHQHLGQLNDDVKSGVLSNARSKLYFQTSTEDARTVLRTLGTDSLSENDLGSLGQYEAYARIATPTGSSAPVSMMTNKPFTSEGNRALVLRGSQLRFGRDAGEVEAQIQERRTAPTSSGTRPAIGTTAWDSDDSE